MDKREARRSLISASAYGASAVVSAYRKLPLAMQRAALDWMRGYEPGTWQREAVAQIAVIAA